MNNNESGTKNTLVISGMVALVMVASSVAYVLGANRNAAAAQVAAPAVAAQSAPAPATGPSCGVQ